MYSCRLRLYLCQIVFALSLICSSSVSAQSADGLVGYWKFDTVTDNTTPDALGTTNPGVLINNPALVEGKFGKAFEFNNQLGSGVELTQPFSSNNWTISLWINLTSPVPVAAPYSGLLTFFSTDPGRQMLAIQKDGVYMYLTKIVDYNFNFNLGWHHIVVSYDGTNLSAIVDNFARGSVPLNNVLASQRFKRRIGMASSATHCFKGVIDEVRVYNRVLTPRESALLYDATLANSAVKPLTVRKIWPPARLPSWTGYSHVEINSDVRMWCRASEIPGQRYEDMPLFFNAASSKKVNLNVMYTEAGKSYTRYVRCLDMYGNQTVNELPVTFEIEKDVIAPEIIEVSASAVRDTTAEIVWSTYEHANSKVEYSAQGGSNTQSSVDPSYDYTHAQLLKGLKPNTTYTYRVISADRAGNTKASPFQSFKTRGPAGLTYYIATNGSDQNDGLTLGTPFATLEKARDTIRTLKSLPAGGIQVSILGGMYPRTKTFVLTKADSGTEGSPIRYAAFNSEPVVFSGAVDITKYFTPVKDTKVLARFDESVRNKIMQVDLRAPGLEITDYGIRKISGAMQRTGFSPLELFFQNKPMTLARWPNLDPLGRKDPESLYTELSTITAVSDPMKTFTTNDTRPDRWKLTTRDGISTDVAAKDIWVHGNWFFNHRHSVLKVTALQKESSGGYTITAPGDVTGIKENRPFFFLNILEELDTPGEWYLDKESGILYFYPPADIATSKAYVSVANNMVEMYGTSYVTLSGLTIENARGKAVYMDRFCRFNMVESSVIRNVSVGAEIAGKQNGVWGSTLYNIEDNAISLYGGTDTTLEGGYNYVESNEIYNFATLNKSYRAAVNLTATDTYTSADPLVGATRGVANRVRFNKIHDAPHYGVVAAGNNLLIDSNELYNVCLETIDCGAIYFSTGSVYYGTAVRYNYIHDVSGFDFEKSYALNAAALYVDNSQSGLHIHSNIINKVDVGLLLNAGRDNIFENNIITNTDEPLHLNTAAMNISAKPFRIPLYDVSNTTPIEITTIRPHNNSFMYETANSRANTVIISEVDGMTGVNGTWPFEVVNDYRIRLLGSKASGVYSGGGFITQDLDLYDDLARYKVKEPPFVSFYPRLGRLMEEVDDAEAKGNQIERNALYNNAVQEFDRMYVGGRKYPNTPYPAAIKKYIPVNPNNVTTIPFEVASPLSSSNFQPLYAAGLTPIPVEQIGPLKVAPPVQSVPSAPGNIRSVD